MRKGIVIIVTVAMLGIVATYTQGGSSPAKKAASTASTVVPSQAASSAVTPAPAANTDSAATAAPASGSASTAGQYKDGTYHGQDYSNRYGDVQISVTIAGGKITAVNFDQLTAFDGHSQQINSYAGPQLKGQTLSAQSASIDGVSGATFTSSSYMQSLQSALDQAKV